MPSMFKLFRQHWPFIIVATIFLLVTTFPTILYVFRTDVFWLPDRIRPDIFKKFWDVWYGKQILTGQADRFYTDLIFYPDGVSLAYHPIFMLHSMFINALMAFMPLSNAYCVAFLAIIYSSALSAYIYINWLFNDKWIALFGATVFGFSAQTTGYPAWPEVAWIAPIPLIAYCLHRGIRNRRLKLVLLAGLIAGLTSEVTPYQLVCVMIMCAMFMLYFAISRWRDKHFWLSAIILAVAIAVACGWRVAPMLRDKEQLQRAAAQANEVGGYRDAMIFFVNVKHPVLGPLAEKLILPPEHQRLFARAYLGIAPVTLIAIGLANSRARRKMRPWLGLLLLFMILCLGSTLSVNGTVIENVRLPKHFLDTIVPSVFAAFYHLPFFMSGAWLPLAVLSCFGLAALRDSARSRVGPLAIVLLACIVAFEYHVPINPEASNFVWSPEVSEERVAYLDWLKSDNTAETRLVNLPLGYIPSTRYSYYQSLSGYPQLEGGISRRPSSAFDFVRSNYLLRTWYSLAPVHCEISDRDDYLAALTELERVGFTHFVFHRVFYGWDRIRESFRGITPRYSDQYVSVFRTGDLRDSCPEEAGLRHQFTDAVAGALRHASAIYYLPGNTVVFPPAHDVGDFFMWYLRHFAYIDRTVITISMNERGDIDLQSSKLRKPEQFLSLEQSNALWLIDLAQAFEADDSAAARDWFAERYKQCARVYADGEITLDLYLKIDLPCQAVAEGSAFEVDYDSGLKLHSVYTDSDEDTLRVILQWSNQPTRRHSYSLQLFDQDGHKALQFDAPIWDDPLSFMEIGISELPDGMYSLQLIVYDFETLASDGGTLIATRQRVDREIEIARVEVKS